MKISEKRSRCCVTGIFIPVLFVAYTLLHCYGCDARWDVASPGLSSFHNLLSGNLPANAPLKLLGDVEDKEAPKLQYPAIDGNVRALSELVRKHVALRRTLGDACLPRKTLLLRGQPIRRARLATVDEVRPLPVPVQVPANSPLSPHRPFTPPPPPLPSPLPLPPAPDPAAPAPPPQEVCKCKDGYTATPSGSPCGCVIPIQVGLELGVNLDTFFPLVPELSKELADGSFLPQSQVRITGATTVANDQERTDVHAELIPLGVAFDNTTAQLIAQRFWTREVEINETLFGNYTILYLRYPGLPPSPPGRASGPNPDGSTTGNRPPGGNLPGTVQPGTRTENRFSQGIIVIISLTSAAGTAVLLGAIWLVALKCCRGESSAVAEEVFTPGGKKSAGSTLPSTRDSFTTLSYSSNFATYLAFARKFTALEIQRATDNFKEENVVGEGGFGRVYKGRLEDGFKVAVKVPTREDDHEYLAEAELLSRLHHRNLVKLLGICIEGGLRALVYEFITNGTVESHLHGVDREVAPLNWDARIKIALGAARGLAYLHEESNPRVIHRDFKASNILLEEDYTPKISDFGLSKVASEGGDHISTRVMGTFGYVAPEYAMTGHLLVKSEVYSYGVVLLELLSGRKAVDRLLPPEEENVVTWARPLLSSREGLDILIDPILGDSVPFDSLARVAAVASMCVHPEVSHRPFMGEVVQALKLVYNDSDASEGRLSFNGSHAGTDVQSCGGRGISEPLGHESCYRPSSMPAGPFSSGPTLSADSEPPPRPISASAILSSSNRFIRQLSGSFRYGSSGPLRTTRSRPAWYRSRHPRGGTVSDHHRNKYDIDLDRDYFEL